MDIYTNTKKKEYFLFLQSCAVIREERRNILDVPPLYTLSEELFEKICKAASLSPENMNSLKNTFDFYKTYIKNILENTYMEDEIVMLSKEEFLKAPAHLSTSDIFLETDIEYEYSHYLEHFKLTKEFATTHKNYSYKTIPNNGLTNLQIHILKNNWVIVSKNKHPAIHFVIRHPKLRNAIENMILPVIN